MSKFYFWWSLTHRSIMMVMKAMYSRTLIKPGGKGCREWQVTGPGRQGWGHWCRSGEVQACLTCKQLRVEHVHGLIVPGILALEVHRVQHVLDEDGEHHSHQDGILGVGGWTYEHRPRAPAKPLSPGLCTAEGHGTSTGLDTAGVLLASPLTS